MPDDGFEHRKGLTFEQAEGAVALPAQLQPKEVSPELRAFLWRVVYDSFVKHTHHKINGWWSIVYRAVGK